MKRWIYIAVGILACTNLFAQDSLGVRKISDFGDWFHSARDLAVLDSLMYVLTPDDGLQIYRVEHYQEPHFVGRNMSLSGTKFELFGDLLIIWQSPSAIRLVDVSASDNPVQRSAITTTTAIKDACVIDNYLYLIRQGIGIEVYSLDNLDQPEQIGELALPAVLQSIGCIHGYLVTTSTDSLRVMDIANPGSPFVVASLTLNGNAGKIEIINEMAYIDRGSGINICDLSVPTQPAIIESFTVMAGGSIITLANADGNLLIELQHPDSWGGYYSYLKLYDLTIPDSPEEVWSWYNSTEHVLASANRGVLAVLNFNFPVFRLFNSSNVDSIFGTFVRENYFYGINEVVVCNGLAATSRGSLGMSLYDVSNPFEPRYLFGSGYWEETQNILMSQSLVAVPVDVYCVPGTLLNIENPSEPIGLQHWFGCGSRYDIRGNQVLLVNNWPPYLLRNIDISDFSNPVITATTELQFAARSLVARDSIVYIADSNGLTLVNITASGSFQVAGSLAMTGTMSQISVDGEIAVLQSGTSSISIVDVADPTNPISVSEFSVQGAIRELDLQGNNVFVANDTRGLRIFDISEPQDPFEAGHYSSGLKAVDVDAQGRYVYLANTGQVVVLDVTVAIGGGIPAAPQEVKLSSTFDPDHLFLTWLPVTMDRVGQPITIDAYEIYRRNSSDEEWVNIGVPTPPSATEYTIDIPVGANAFAEYQVRAVKH